MFVRNKVHYPIEHQISLSLCGIEKKIVVIHMMRWVIDLMLLAVLLLCAFNGYRKGILMEVGAVVCLLISLYGATVIANNFSMEVVAAVKPFAGGYIEGVFANDVPVLLGYDLNEYSVNDIVASDPEKAYDVAEATFLCMGIYEDTAAELAEEAQTYAAENGVPLRSAIVDITCNTGVYAASVALCFMIILIFLTFLGNLPNLSFRLPNMEEMDEIGGAVVGVVRGALLGMLAVWVLKFMGILIGEDTISSTILAKLFDKIGIISFFLGV